jgi:hypothetical protein
MSEIWSALGGELKPSLDVRVVAPVLTERVAEAGPRCSSRSPWTCAPASGR